MNSSNQPIDQDFVSIHFGNIIIDDWTSYNIEQDFFTCSDAFTATLEDSKDTQLAQYMVLGQQVRVYIAGNLQMIAYLDDIDISYTRNGGTKLTISGRDILGQAAQAYILPNVGTSSDNNFHFTANTTFSQAFAQIFGSFQPNLDISITGDTDAEGKSLTLKSGGQFGVRVKRKGNVRDQTQVRSFTDSLKHLLQPGLNETYLSYAKKLANCLGCYIKVILVPNGTNIEEQILISPPTYDRSSASPFILRHSHDSTLSILNNVLQGSLRFSAKEQFSVIIGQSTLGQPGYRKKTQKNICINELTGYSAPANNIYDLSIKLANATSNQQLDNTIQNVKNAIKDLTQNKGYILMESNLDIYNVFSQLPIKVSTNYSRPFYYESKEAHEGQELSMSVRKLMAENQNKFLQAHYTVDGHSISGVVWQPNCMCQLQDDVVNNTAPINTQLWIEKVNFTRTRQDGPKTHLKLNLPYTNTAIIDNTAVIKS
jgi:hypothetical protein